MFYENQIFQCMKEQIEYALYKKKWTLKKLSEKTKLSPYQIKQVMNGNKNVAFAHYLKIFNILDIKMVNDNREASFQNYFFDFNPVVQQIENCSWKTGKML